MTSTFHAIGLMSGTSMDGVDAVAMRFAAGHHATSPMTRLGHVHLPMPPDLRAELLALNTPGHNELHRSQVAAIALMQCYAQAVQALLGQIQRLPQHIDAIGAHGQTVRHHPQPVSPQAPHGYTLQLAQPALLAELTGIRVVADFRSRDVAAGGQGAPLVPAFHRAWLGLDAGHTEAQAAQADGATVVLNWGGIGNVSILRKGSVLGFDTGPANALLDLWCERHTGAPFDRDGAWAASGRVHASLLQALLRHPFFERQPPKSTGRDDFHLAWLDAQLAQLAQIRPANGATNGASNESPNGPPSGPAGQALAEPIAPQDVQATLAELTSQSTAQAIARHAPDATRLVVCGGGAHNRDLMGRLRAQLPQLTFSRADEHGLHGDEVEAAAFAWLAWRCCSGLPGNLPEVSNASGPRILGAIYPK